MSTRSSRTHTVHGHRRWAAWLLALALAPAATGAHLEADAPTGDRTVPDCVGLTIAAAQALAREGGFETQLSPGPSGPEGVVLGQDPGGLAVRPAGSTLTLMVGGGPVTVPPVPVEPPAPPVAPPPVQPAPGAEPLPPPAGPLPDLPPPTVTPHPAPGPGNELPPPAQPPAQPPSPTPSIDLASLPEEALPNTNGPTVPSVLGLTRSEAQRRLQGWRVVTELTLVPPESNGRVVEQDPAPSATLAPGESVTVVVGTVSPPGPDMRQVPALVGTGVDEAVVALRAAGFDAVLRCAPSDDQNRGRVLVQLPRRYSFGQRGLAVKLIVGRGGVNAAPVAVPPSPAFPPSPAGPGPGEPTPPSGPLPTPPVPAPGPSPAPEGTPTPMPPAPPPVPIEPPTPPTPPAPPKPPAPGAVALLGPVDGESAPRAYGATFEWRTVPNSDGYEWELQVETSGAWRQSQVEKLVGTKFRPARLEAGRYRWRVRALNGESPGAWTDFRLLYRY